MLFNSFPFIFVFLPGVALGFYLLARVSHASAAGWLALSSLFFYGYWNPKYVGLLAGSILANFVLGRWIALAHTQQAEMRKKRLLLVALTANIAALVYYKYTNFFIGSANDVLGTAWSFRKIILPLGISFFTFTQIAFLVDTFQGKVKEYNFVQYLLFVTYFPHLIAGPVLHHKEMMPQFERASTYRFGYENLSVGVTIFFVGLFKKVILADGIAGYADQIFSASSSGVALTFIDAWGGALCYALQLYFDFSGYSDMAIGTSRMFGVTLPLNFHSPYKSANIIEFWRRWHMTLSRFLRDYVYIPLGGNRKGAVRRYVNLMLTMLLGGLWHGAGWTYVLWGGLHGLYLTVNHGWHALRRALGHDPEAPLPGPLHALAVLGTFLAVVTAWVVFRAEKAAAAAAMIKTMAGLNGIAPPGGWLHLWTVVVQWVSTRGGASGTAGNLLPVAAIAWIALSLAIVWFAPNTQQIMHSYAPALDLPAAIGRPHLSWQPSTRAALIVWLIGFVAIVKLNKYSAFLYFQF